MKYHVDKKSMLSNTPKNPSLYEWCIVGLDDNGKPNSSEHIPFNWSVYFICTDLKANIRIDGKDPQTDKAPSRLVQMDTSMQEFISGRLKPQIEHQSKCFFAFFGCNRELNDIRITIWRSNIKNEVCNIFGSIKYTDAEYVHSADDYIDINISLVNENYDKINNYIPSSGRNALVLRLTKVSGFYSEWSPDIDTDSIKILASISDQLSENAENLELEPPVLGAVGAFSLTLSNLKKTIPNAKTYDESLHEAEVEEFDHGGNQNTADTDENGTKEYGAFDLRSRQRLLRSSHATAVAVWIILALELIKLLFK